MYLCVGLAPQKAPFKLKPMHQETLSPQAKLTPIAKSLPTVMSTTLPMSHDCDEESTRDDDFHGENNYSDENPGSGSSKETTLEQEGALSCLKILQKTHDFC